MLPWNSWTKYPGPSQAPWLTSTGIGVISVRRNRTATVKGPPVRSVPAKGRTKPPSVCSTPRPSAFGKLWGPVNLSPSIVPAGSPEAKSTVSTGAGTSAST